MWFELKGDERLSRCASEGCGGQPTFRLEADGIGSNYCSGCKAEISRSRMSDESGWIIEKDDPPVYHLLSGDYDEHWTSDVNKALRFARKEDAEAYADHIGWTSPPVRTAEHMWPMPRVVRF